MNHLLISAPFKSSGKTTITLGICGALKARGLKVQPFKKGPDYIDPMWLSRAAQQPCFNLDFNNMSHQEILDAYAKHSHGSDISIIEANMGLFDRTDIEGLGSNAALARHLQTPVVLVINVQGATRSIVPMILGFSQFEPSTPLAGVILNNVGGKRHERRLREVIQHYTDIPIIGAILRDERLAISERHLGLIPSNEEQEAEAKIDQITTLIGAQVDLDRLLELASHPEQQGSPLPRLVPPPNFTGLRVGIAQDEAFGFYYPSDLEKIRTTGATLIPFSPMHDTNLPDHLDGLFIGGGFPETQLTQLSQNHSMRHSIHRAIEAGLPTYAECGGLMYLSNSVEWQGATEKLVGIIPGYCKVHKRPAGHGYAHMRLTPAHPWSRFGMQSQLSAHEFHYSTLEGIPDGSCFGYQLDKGFGINSHHDGFIYKNLLANYVHLRDTERYPWVVPFLSWVKDHTPRRST